MFRNNNASPQRIAPRPNTAANPRPAQQQPSNPSQSTGAPGLSNSPQQQLGQPTSTVPQINFTDFRLVSSAKASKHNVLKFASNKPVHLKNFAPPIKLHRKDPNAPSNAVGSAAAAANSFQEVIGGAGVADPNMAGSQFGPKSGADTTLIAPLGGATRNKQMLFKKRTKQIFLAKEDTRKIKEQEQKPWVLEDYDGQNTWLGTLEGGQQAHYVLFVFSDNGFKVVPVSRWYNFQAKIGYQTLSLEEAEEQLKKQSKSPGGPRWIMKRVKDASMGEDKDGGRMMMKKVEVGRRKEGGYVTPYFARLGSCTAATISQFHKRHRLQGSDIDADDLDFDEVWQDDEEAAAEIDLDEEETNDVNARAKKQMKELGSGDEEEEGGDDDNMELTNEGKSIIHHNNHRLQQMKKLVRNLEENQQYEESDDEKDPYASSEEEEDGVVEPTEDEKGEQKETSPDATKELLKRPQKPSSSTSTTGGVGNTPKKKAKEGPSKGLTASAVAKKLNPINKSKSVKPPASPSGRIKTEKQGSASPPRASSPVSSPPRAMSPNAATISGTTTAAASKQRKRPAPGDGSVDVSTGGEATKKMKLGASSASSPSPRPSSAAASPATHAPSPSPSSAGNASPSSDANLIIEQEVIAVLRGNRLTTKDFLSAFKKKLKKDERNKARITHFLKRVARHVDIEGSERLLELKPEFITQ
ncbi:hypothetical protein BC936DRAFT_149039 [Jimgerdemannia flammicorona]|uniref:Uncharacterized protein n=2 Tax=Jimgerdemannia flammicorona TaxID=994334 RepID=A0A433D1Q0_9FUNG|nr:hypothetical protein BC936DRAFT_149039 [Jimgerdemannia flammicorona]RUS25252.1 hypothetical protein BC938DRAFT_472423 [Jimgerdemannia flammicorona]